MPDISMCQNMDCPSRQTCYRFLAIPDELLQSYGKFDFGENDRCDYYWPTVAEKAATDGGRK